MIVPLNITTKNRAVAILTPKETDLIYAELNTDYKIRANYLLETAMRVSEAIYVMLHPECFREENEAIFLPEVKGLGKVRCTITNRQIMLSQSGVAAVKRFLTDKPGLPAYQNMEEAFKRAAKRADFDIKYITTKLYRKTMISWLMNVYPERQSQIAFSAGHDYNTMRKYYLTYGFRKEDVRDMKDRLRGWGEA
jgi:integrase